jgi:hypothetical protein
VLAAAAGLVEVVRSLLQWEGYFSRPYHRKDELRDALLVTCQHGSLPTVQLVVAHIDEKDRDHLLGQGVIAACEAGQAAVVSYLMELRTPGCRYHYEKGLTEAAKNGHVAVVRQLLPIVDGEGTKGGFRQLLDDCMLEAIQRRHLEVVVALLQEGADLPRQDTPLLDNLVVMAEEGGKPELGEAFEVGRRKVRL